jgi:hypothetical protein
MTAMSAVVQISARAAACAGSIDVFCSLFARGRLPDESDQNNPFAMNGLLHTIAIGL